VAKFLYIEATCSGLLSVEMSLPVGVASGTVRLPLGNRTASQVEVLESGEVVWDGTKYVGGVDGVRSAASGSTPAGEQSMWKWAAGTMSSHSRARPHDMSNGWHITIRVTGVVVGVVVMVVVSVVAVVVVSVVAVVVVAAVVGNASQFTLQVAKMCELNFCCLIKNITTIRYEALRPKYQI